MECGLRGAAGPAGRAQPESRSFPPLFQALPRPLWGFEGSTHRAPSQSSLYLVP